MSTRPRPFVERLADKIARRGADDCWLWRGGRTRGQGRETDYGVIREGRPSTRLWRAHRVVLLLEELPPGVHGDAVLDLLHTINRLHAHEEASHLCDVSLCCNPRHLRWESHTANVVGQARRRFAS